MDNEQHLQWRISFTKQELLLVRGFNSVQMKCYVLLKNVKRYFIQAAIKEETLTSYHCKTCMFYSIENTPTDFWVPENLASGLLMCLRQIMVWVTNDNCPNYFIPGENMFDRICNDTLKKQLLIYLHIIILFSFDSLLRVLHKDIFSCIRKVHNIVKLRQIISYELEEIATGQMMLSDKEAFIRYLKDALFTENMVGVLRNVMFSRIHIMYKCLDTKYHFIVIDKLHTKITELEQTTTVTNHTEEQSKEAISLVLPFLQLKLLSLRVVETLEKRKEKLEWILNNQKWAELDILIGCSKLKQACAMLVLGYTNKSFNILMDISQDRKRANHPLCNCYTNVPPVASSCIITGVTSKQQNIMTKTLLANYYLPCVNFLPNEYHISPLAINYEMIRRYGRAPLEAQKLMPLWFDWGAVEGIFLTQFLMYINAKVLGKESLAIKAINKMIRICIKRFPYHLDTSLNLLGWVFMDRGDTTRAGECFQKSLRVQPMYNAACWHLCFLICGY